MMKSARTTLEVDLERDGAERLGAITGLTFSSTPS
jgi:hypothetical protein